MLHLLLLLLLHTPFLLVTSAEHLAPAEAPVHHHYRYIHRRDHPKHHGYVHPPVKPPTYPPPAHPPSYEPPHHRVRTLVAVQGVVFCKSCNYTGIDTLLGASPLPGAEVILKSKDIVLSPEPKAITDKNGYFFLEAPAEINSYRAAHRCRVYLVATPPHSPCQTPTNLHSGLIGAVLQPDLKSNVSVSQPFTVFDVGPFAYEPPKCGKH